MGHLGTVMLLSYSSGQGVPQSRHQVSEDGGEIHGEQEKDHHVVQS
jgi:hypothetical protein